MDGILELEAAKCAMTLIKAVMKPRSAQKIDLNPNLGSIGLLEAEKARSFQASAIEPQFME